MALPIFQTPDRNLSMLQTQWASQLNPVLANPTTNLSILKDIVLKAGTNVINHKLGQKMQGWFLTDIQGPAVIYRNAELNNLTLSLSCSAPVTVSIGVF